MATIQRKTQKSGAISYKAIIRKSGLRTITKTFRTKTLAHSWVTQVENSVNLRRALVSYADRILLGELIELFKEDWSGKSDGHASQLKFWTQELGHMKAIEIASVDIREKLDELKDGTMLRGDGKGKTAAVEGRRRPSTINKYRAALSSVYRFGMDKYGLPSNPVSGVKGETENNVRVRFLSDTERAALLDACMQSDWDKLNLIVVLAITTGARKSELLQLRWGDINFQTRTAQLHDTKNGEGRILTLPAPAINTLLPFREVGNGLVFPSLMKPSQPIVFKKHWERAIQTSGVKNFVFHDLRHTCASMLRMDGNSLENIAEVLGHRQLSVTMRYAHIDSSFKQQMTDKTFGVL